MSALGKQFITVNSTALPETAGFDIDYGVKENVFETEAGTDIGVLIRTGKRTFSVKWERQPDSLKTNLETFSNAATVTVVFNGNTYTCRARNLKESLVTYSNRYPGSAGLWNLSIDFIEV